MRATRTLVAIEQAMLLDQGARYRELLKKYMDKAKDPFRGVESPFREHLGASIAGGKCERELWYSFRWAFHPVHDSRLLRLFNRGHLEEPRMLALLEMIGCEIWSTTVSGGQFKFSDSHTGGSLDGVAKGIPDLHPDTWCLTEFKTHSDKSFIKLDQVGVLASKFKHFVQMQLYMGWWKLPYALYLAVNKNNDELYGEIVKFDYNVFERYFNRAKRIAMAKEPPPRLSNDPTYFDCKFCSYKSICHGDQIPHKSCRTCKHVNIAHSSQVFCGSASEPIPAYEQEIGCTAYEPATETFKRKP